MLQTGDGENLVERWYEGRGRQNDRNKVRIERNSSPSKKSNEVRTTGTKKHSQNKRDVNGSRTEEPKFTGEGGAVV